ncbi:LolA family protein [Sphingomonas solaris]|uniref:LolA family protein n=1 Tax=Alterirhizorhabdus solaris TaxID=2529389 RepID=UPI001EEF85DA|nr:outer membrane lipoprotein carrier protein LolA [Sphingomonas solaris]
MTVRTPALLSSLGLALALPAVAIAAPSPLAQVSDHLRAVETMTANFVQTDRNGKAIGGTLTLKRPGRIRFQYQKGVPLLVVGDGKALTMIDYSVKQVSRWPIGNSPLGILLDPSRDLGQAAQVLSQPDPRVLVIAAKDPKHPEYGTITIAFARLAGAPAGLMLRGWTVLDAQGNRSTIQLTDQKFNVPVPANAFRWDDPRQQGPRR